MYITIPRKQNTTTQMTIDDLFHSDSITTREITKTVTFQQHNLTTYWRDHYRRHYAKENAIIRRLADTARRQFPNDSSQYYNPPFKIPKASGGYREINAPGDTLMWFLKELNKTLTTRLQLLAHNNAYAYIQHRSVKDCAIQHKDNDWFLKLDLKHFFPSCTKQLILSKLKQIYPLHYMIADYPEDWETLIDVALLHGVLPQGSPLSPLLSNLIMIPFDTNITNILNKYNITYTRYADDIHLSSPNPINVQTIINVITDTLTRLGYPFELNNDKTRTGSNKGKNWMLGVMLNKNHEITVGHRRKKRFKAALYNFIQSLTNNNPWDIIDVRTLLGEYSYIHNIEPTTAEQIVETYNAKYNVNVLNEIRTILA